jgi:hypothetical protein
MKLNGASIFNRNNIPLLVFCTGVTIYLFKHGQLDGLLWVVPLLYILHPTILKVYRDNMVPSKRKRMEQRAINDTYLEGILTKLRSYRRFSPINYRKGMQNIRMFVKHVQKISRSSSIDEKTNHSENAELSLKVSLNYFQSLSFSIPHSSSNKQVGELCKQLDDYCQRVLINISRKNNETGGSYTSERYINMVHASNSYTNHEIF